MIKIKQTIVISLLLAGCLAVVKPAQALTYQELLDYFRQPQVLGATTTGLVGYWNFDEGSGTTTADSSGNNNNATINGATWIAGRIGNNSVSFNGSGEYINDGKGASLNNLPALTYSAWIYPRSFNSTGVVNAILGKRYKEFGFISGKPYFFVSTNSSNVSISCNVTVALNTWTHMAVVWDGTVGSLSSGNFYVNGVPCAFVGNPGSGTPIADAARDLAVGANFNDSLGQYGSFLDGNVDELRIYNRALSAQEILDIYSDTGGTVTPPPSDTTAPSVPTGLSATAISSSQINLSWTASTDNVGVTGYKVYRNGTQIATTANNNYNDNNNLSPNTAYSYTVSAYDAAGNNSGQSSSASATTQPTTSSTTHTYWVSPTGAASWANCNSDTPLNDEAACSFSTANSNADAGDTVYYRGGTYNLIGSAKQANVYAIKPSHTGTSGAKITFSAYTGETPIFTQAGDVDTGGVAIKGKSWIKITGLTFKNLHLDNYISGDATNGADYNEIAYSSFINTTTVAQQTAYRLFELGASVTAPWSTHNWFHNNYLSSRANINPCGEGTDLMRIGMAQSAPNYSEDNYNTVEDNYFEYSGHANIISYGRMNVIRNNTMHNEPWITGCANYKGGPDSYYSFNIGTFSTSAATFGVGAHTVMVAPDLDTNHWKPGAQFAIVEIDPGTGLPISYGMSYGPAHNGPYGSITGYNATTGQLDFNVVSSTDMVGSGSYANWAIALNNIPAYDNAAYNGLYSHRVAGIGDNYNTEPDYNLVENNRIGYAGVNPHNGGADNLDISQAYNIVRYNYLYAAMAGGLGIKTTTGRSLQNYIYNNTIYHNGFGYNWDVFNGTNNTISKGGVVESSVYNNVFKNNLLYDNDQYNRGRDICSANSYYLSQQCTVAIGDVLDSNWTTANGNPKFTNPDLSNPLSQNLIPSAHGYTTTPMPDLSLQSSSPVINQAKPLTEASGAGTNSTVLVVKSATGSANELCPSCYFQDGTWGSDLARGVDFFPDWIAIGSVNNVVQISSINYSTNTITLASPMTWSSSANIWLYKKSDGAVVLAGSAPDIGAYEYTGGTTPPDTTPPSPPTGVAVQ
jgi:hypothetical protein